MSSSRTLLFSPLNRLIACSTQILNLASLYLFASGRILTRKSIVSRFRAYTVAFVLK